MFGRCTLTEWLQLRFKPGLGTLQRGPCHLLTGWSSRLKGCGGDLHLDGVLEEQGELMRGGGFLLPVVGAGAILGSGGKMGALQQLLCTQRAGLLQQEHLINGELHGGGWSGWEIRRREVWVWWMRDVSAQRV